MTSPSTSWPFVSRAKLVTVAVVGTVNQYQPSMGWLPGFEKVWSTSVSAMPSRRTACTTSLAIPSFFAGAPGGPFGSIP